MKKHFTSLALLFGVCLLFFWPIFKGYIPFPGDLLIDSNPYRSLSFMGYAPGAYPNKAQGQDVISETYPWRYFTIQELKQGRIPFWNPHNFSGNIHMQNFQSSVFNPFNGVFFLFSFNTAWTLFIFLQPLLASFFFYLFARELHLSKFASIVGAVGFAFSSYMTVWIEYGNISATFAYLPLLLFFLYRFLKQHAVLDYIGFVVAGTLMILSGYIQGAFYIYVFCLLFTLYCVAKEKVRVTKESLLTILALFGFPLLLSMFQLMSTYEIFLQSTRWPYSVKQFAIILQPFWYWITLFASDFFGNPATRNYYLNTTYIERVAYIGIPLLIFAAYAVIKKQRFAFFLFWTAIAIAIFTTNLPGVAYVYTLPIPVIDTTISTRFLSIFMFCGVLLASIGIDAFFVKKQVSKLTIGIFLGLYACIWILLVFAKKFYPQFDVQIAISQHNFIIPTALVLATCSIFLLAKKFPLLSKALLITLVVADLFYVFQKITPFAPPSAAYPKTPVMTYLQHNAGINRFWGYGSGYIQSNFQTIDGTYSPEGNDPLHSKNYGELLTSSFDGRLPKLPPRPDANLAQGYGPDGMKNPYRQTLLNLLGIKYIIQHDELRKDNEPDTQIFPPEKYALVFSKSPWQIYENKNVFPRYFLVNQFITATEQKSLDLLYTTDLSKTVILPNSLRQEFSADTKGSVELLSYETQKVSFTTKTTKPMILFLSDTYSPSWKATIDGTAVPLYLADYAFRAVVVPAGTHTVVMYYDAMYFRVGLTVAGIAFVFFLISIWFVKQYEYKK